MAYVLKADPSANAVAVYSVPSFPADTAPLSDPYSNLTRLKFHSSFYYPYLVSIGGNTVQTGSVSFPTTASGTLANVAAAETQTLFAHGLGAPPMLTGYLVNRYGQTINLFGTTYIWDPDGGANNWAAYSNDSRRFNGWYVELCADNTNVYLQFRYYRRPASTSRNQSNVSYTYFVRVYSDTTSGIASQGDGSALFYHNAGVVTMGRGRIDSRRRYLRRDDASGWPFPTSPTAQANVFNLSGSLQGGYAWAEFDAGNYYRQWIFANATATGVFSRSLTASYFGVTA